MISISRCCDQNSLEISARRCRIQYVNSHFSIGINDENGSAGQGYTVFIHLISIEHIQFYRQ